jgi:hypothetical protein
VLGPSAREQIASIHRLPRVCILGNLDSEVTPLPTRKGPGAFSEWGQVANPDRTRTETK